MKKKILIIDDSTLMRRVLSDIINESENYQVCLVAPDGVEGLKIVEDERFKDINIIFLDIHMPRMGGIEFLRILKQKGIVRNIVVFSSVATNDCEDTIEALDLGALEFVKKPEGILTNKQEFAKQIISLLDAINSKEQYISNTYDAKNAVSHSKEKHEVKFANASLVAIACSTGGPKALQCVIPKLSKNINCPVLIVQHMPKGFTNSLAERLNDISDITVSEAKDGDILEPGHVYIAKGGQHMKLSKDNVLHISLTDDAPVGGLRPYANYMYESIIDTPLDNILCVVLTGMGADGTEGIRKLNKRKNIYVISQDEPSCTVYGMPRSVAESGLTNEVCALEDIARAILNKTGVQ